MSKIPEAIPYATVVDEVSELKKEIMELKKVINQLKATSNFVKNHPLFIATKNNHMRSTGGKHEER